MRDLVRETHLQPSNFILPLFVVEGEGIRKPISSMPGNAQISIDELVKEAREAKALGIGGVILFGIPKHKDENATGAYDDEGIVQKACGALKQEVPGLLVVAGFGISPSSFSTTGAARDSHEWRLISGPRNERWRASACFRGWPLVRSVRAPATQRGTNHPTEIR